MARTFEELASSEMDALYQGALFLSGGKCEAAEALVVDAVMLAFSEHAADIDPAQTRRWFEARLVHAYHRRVGMHSGGAPPPARIRDAVSPHAFDDLGPEGLFTAAKALPPGPRSALWLVVMRRWSRADAAAAMRIDLAQLEVVLAYRDVLLKELLASRPRRRGARESI